MKVITRHSRFYPLKSEIKITWICQSIIQVFSIEVSESDCRHFVLMVDQGISYVPVDDWRIRCDKLNEIVDKVAQYDRDKNK